jgi:hypothetical protein
MPLRSFGPGVFLNPCPMVAAGGRLAQQLASAAVHMEGKKGRNAGQMSYT